MEVYEALIETNSRIMSPFDHLCFYVGYPKKNWAVVIHVLLSVHKADVKMKFLYMLKQ